MELLTAAGDWADRACVEAMLPLAIWIFISGVDDLFIAAAYFWARCSGKLPVPHGLAPAGQRELRVAIFVPLWHEESVIAGMLEHNLSAVNYRNFEFFVGVYPNDAGTLRVVRGVAARSPQVHLALCPHDGPTSKADCMNWIYQRMLLYEREHGVEFDIVMTHDAEDLIHPDELRLVNYYAADYDMIQVPVLPLSTPIGDWTHGFYCDDFAEFHGKDLPARWWLGGFIPSCGVGTAFTRQAIESLAAAESNLIFRPDCLTEDYETGYRLHKLGFKQVFMPICRAKGLNSSPVATREYFPRRFRSALRQRTRWTTGIALQAWERHGWGSGWQDAYWFWHDRKGLIGNPASLAANVILVYGVITWVASLATHTAWGLAQQMPGFALLLLPMTATLGIGLAAVRMSCSASVYGWRFAAFSPVRLLLGNLLNTLAVVAAVYRFAESVWSGQALVWLKTEHAYPNLAALDSYNPPLETVLISMGALTAEALNLARQTSSTLPLPERLLAFGLVTEEALLEAMMLRHNLAGGEVLSNQVNTSLLRLLPQQLAAVAKVVPVGLREGVVRLACPDLPSESSLEYLRRHLRLQLEFYLVSKRNFAELRRLTNS